jgi:hypothetical protein
MEAAKSSEKLVNFYQITRRFNPEDSHLRTNRRENLKSYILKHVYAVKMMASLIVKLRVFKRHIFIAYGAVLNCDILLLAFSHEQFSFISFNMHITLKSVSGK